jgi:transposase
MNYIGVDSHISTMDFKVVGESGSVKMAQHIATSASNFIEFVKKVPKPREIIVEEGPLAGWLLEMCNGNGETLVISDPKHNRWICSSGPKADPIDAGKLAQLRRGGFIKEIHHPVGERRLFRALMIAYHDNVKSVVRIKNKIKAMFLQNGIQCPGETVYLPLHRNQWRDKLPRESSVLVIVDSLWAQLDKSQETQAAILDEARNQARKYPEMKLLDGIPGVGFIHASTISAMLETPHRFANKRKVWMYAGLGIDKKSSAGKILSEKLSKDYNRLLKYAAKQAAQAAIKGNNAFRKTYLEMTLHKGIATHKAELTIARDILATAWAMWKKGERYNPDINKRKEAQIETGPKGS